MKRQGTGYGSCQVSPGIKNPHDHTPVEFTLAGARLVNRTPYTIPVRPEKPAGRRVLIGKSVILKNLPLVVIDTGDERGAG
jgi:hypothetical protein